MANIVCSMCGNEPAAFILTNLESGDNETPGVECFPTFILGIAEALTQSIEAAPEAAPGADTTGTNLEGNTVPVAGVVMPDQGESTETPAGSSETPAEADSVPTPEPGPTTQPGPTQSESASPGTDVDQADEAPDTESVASAPAN
jgi:hypothetical protein